MVDLIVGVNKRAKVMDHVLGSTEGFASKDSVRWKCSCVALNFSAKIFSNIYINIYLMTMSILKTDDRRQVIG